MRISQALLGFWALAFITTAAPVADATIIYSFSNLEMINGVNPPVYASGEFEFPKVSNLPLSNLTSAWSVPTAVNFTITDKGSFSRSFTDPNYFIYQDGIAGGSLYVVNLGFNANLPRLDAWGDQFGLAIILGKVVSGDFSTFTFSRGFSSDSLPPIPVKETNSAPEPGTFFLFFAGLFFIGCGVYCSKPSDLKIRDEMA